jgi:hypothetical protein
MREVGVNAWIIPSNGRAIINNELERMRNTSSWPSVEVLLVF